MHINKNIWAIYKSVCYTHFSLFTLTLIRNICLLCYKNGLLPDQISCTSAGIIDTLKYGVSINSYWNAFRKICI